MYVKGKGESKDSIKVRLSPFLFLFSLKILFYSADISATIFR